MKRFFCLIAVCLLLANCGESDDSASSSAIEEDAQSANVAVAETEDDSSNTVETSTSTDQDVQASDDAEPVAPTPTATLGPARIVPAGQEFILGEGLTRDERMIEVLTYVHALVADGGSDEALDIWLSAECRNPVGAQWVRDLLSNGPQDLTFVPDTFVSSGRNRLDGPSWDTYPWGRDNISLVFAREDYWGLSVDLSLGGIRHDEETDDFYIVPEEGCTNFDGPDEFASQRLDLQQSFASLAESVLAGEWRDAASFTDCGIRSMMLAWIEGDRSGSMTASTIQDYVDDSEFVEVSPTHFLQVSKTYTVVDGAEDDNEVEVGGTGRPFVRDEWRFRENVEYPGWYAQRCPE